MRGDDIGAVYLWVDADKRPAVIGTSVTALRAKLQPDDALWVIVVGHSHSG